MPLGAAIARPRCGETRCGETDGRTVTLFVQGTWQKPGKAMKPAWDKLMKQYDGHASIVVADVERWGWLFDVSKA